MDIVSLMACKTYGIWTIYLQSTCLNFLFVKTRSKRYTYSEQAASETILDVGSEIREPL